jgi:Zn-dependent M28 family amino/carboxypeptidase
VNKHAWLLAIVLACACKRDSANAAAFNGEAAFQYAQAQVNFGPRVPGTPAWRTAGDWIVAQMRQRADTVIEQTWWHKLANGDSIPMRNILARYNLKATDRILYLTHWDTRPIADSETDSAKRLLPIPGANDGASGVGLFVALGDVLKAAPPTVGVDLLFVDGEDYGDFDQDKDVLIGSRYFATHLPSPGYQPIFGVLWDMIGDKDLQIYQEQNSLNQAPEVVSRVWQIAAKQGHADVFVPQAKWAVTDDHIPLLQAGLHVIDVIDLDYPDHHRLSDTMDKISAKSLKVVGDVATALIYAQE